MTTANPSHARPSGTTQAWRTFRRWQRSRPFWGGLLTALAGLEMFGSTRMTINGLSFHSGATGLLSLLIPAILVTCGLLLWLSPAHRLFYSIVAAVTTVYSLIGLNLGGFFVGLLLGMVGSALAFAWTPTRPAPTEADQAEAAQTDAAPIEAARTEAARTEAARTEADRTEADGTEAARTEADRTETDGTEAARTEADAEPAGAEQVGVDQVGVDRAGVLRPATEQVDGARASAAGADERAEAGERSGAGERSDHPTVDLGTPGERPSGSANPRTFTIVLVVLGLAATGLAIQPRPVQAAPSRPAATACPTPSRTPTPSPTRTTPTATPTASPTPGRTSGGNLISDILHGIGDLLTGGRRGPARLRRRARRRSRPPRRPGRRRPAPVPPPARRRPRRGRARRVRRHRARWNRASPCRASPPTRRCRRWPRRRPSSPAPR
ncbi:hypothetical protein GCM10027614_51500 [Micromonospora vulcania]